MKKKLIILLQIIITIVLVGTSVYATVNATLDLKVSSTTVKKGDELTITLTLKDVESDKKVRSISGYVNYDENIIEKITVDNIVKNNDNTVKIGNETLNVEDLTNRSIDDMPDTSAYLGFNGAPTSNNDIRMVIDFNSGISADTDLFTMKFKVKSDADLGEVENAIEYKMFVITAGSSEKSQEITKNVKLTITNSNTAGDNNNNNNNNNDNKNDNNNGNNNNGNNNNGNNNNGNNNNGNNNNGNNNNGNNNNGNNNNGNNNNGNNNNGNNNNKNTTNTNSSKNNTSINAKTNNTVDNTIASSVLPATGAKAIIIPAVILILCAYIFYNKYMKYKQI